MANLAGESNAEALRLDFDRRLMLQFLFTSVANAKRRVPAPAPPPPMPKRIPGRMVFSWYMVYEFDYSLPNVAIGDAASIAG
jgi:hypothetical protein